MKTKRLHMRLLLPSFLLIALISAVPSSGQTISSSLYFETNRSILSSEQQAKLVTFLKSLDTVQVTRLSITAYCDDRGSDVYNKNLSLKRAAFLKQAINSGLPGIPAETDGKGEVALAGKVDTDTERAINRRAEISVAYVPKPQTAAPKAAEKARVAEEKKAPASLPATTASPTAKKELVITDDQKVGDKITLENILFAGGRHILLPESFESLESLKNLLLEKKKYHIMILGHICCITSGEDGMDFDTGIKNLSVARAKAVYNYLVQNGVSPNRLSYKGMRANYPTGKSDREDRRVEIEINQDRGRMI